jgi:predicted alpha/beta-hydrolase family hydrolase
MLSPNGENSAEIQALEPLCCKFAGRASAQAVALLPRSLERQAKPIYAAQDRASKVDLRILGFIRESGKKNAQVRLLLAHGAGAGVTSPFFEIITPLIVNHGIAVTRFEFAYMAGRRQGGTKRPPPRAEKLTAEYRDMVHVMLREKPRDQTLLLGGKSLGGRVASLIAGELYERGDIAGLVCLGYPFHPPGKPDQLRTAHLEALACPTLIVQGERDPFGTRAEVESLTISKAITFAWIHDGNHDLRPPVRSGLTYDEALATAAEAIAAFAARVRLVR